jgi:putative nucleotidyltransferase with HDIG domain
MAANSVASSPRDPVSTIEGAVARIGSRSTTNLVLALAVTTVFVPRDRWEQSLWRHGVQVAHAARRLAQAVADDGVDPETIYATALLHDVGRFVMFQVAPDELRLVDEGDWTTPEALTEQEKDICGLTHPEIGAFACRKWGLPEVICHAVRYHHRPLTGAPTTPQDRALAIVRLADLAMFPSAVPGTEGLHETLDAEALADQLAPVMPDFVRLAGPGLADLIGGAAADADAACRALGLNA